ncbi:hypothetical protein O181_092805 [Austropuccinia psidii MF-1]|uniref:Uncharacterized protein n=1 Tax=Austropuccinia psidii MF-1 TaxID=1389203 RepID=A0A9Q3J0G9_9BASI|nr:hypothetical protein [Austropuccinia psidii MF-1]
MPTLTHELASASLPNPLQPLACLLLMLRHPHSIFCTYNPYTPTRPQDMPPMPPSSPLMPPPTPYHPYTCVVPSQHASDATLTLA